MGTNYEPFKPAIENVSRSINLVKKAKDIKEINPTLFEEDAEEALYNVVISLQNQWTYMPGEEKIQSNCSFTCTCNWNFVESVMVMAEDLSVRDNRIALLSEVVALTVLWLIFLWLIQNKIDRFTDRKFIYDSKKAVSKIWVLSVILTIIFMKKGTRNGNYKWTSRTY